MLAPRWESAAAQAEVRERWRAGRSWRLDGLLADEAIGELHAAIRALPHTLIAGSTPEYGFQYAAFVGAPEDDCDHVWCRFGRWWWDEGVAFVAALTGMELRPPEDRRVVATRFGRGGFLDPHNDHDGARRCAYVLGLTRDTWAPELGGHLEFLAVEGDQVTVRERRPPGWNTLDLFDVTGTAQLHQVSIVTSGEVERRAITGWFY